MDFFNNESETIQIGDLTIENRVGRVQIYGSIPRSKEGIKPCNVLMDLLHDIQIELIYEDDIPDTLPPEGENVEVVKNPFDGGSDG